MRVGGRDTLRDNMRNVRLNLWFFSGKVRKNIKIRQVEDLYARDDQNMSSLDSITSILTGLKKELQEKYNVREIYIYGSRAKKSPYYKKDINIFLILKKRYLVFDDYMELKNFLENRLSAEIELFLKIGVKKEIKELLLSKAVYAL